MGNSRISIDRILYDGMHGRKTIHSTGFFLLPSYVYAWTYVLLNGAVGNVGDILTEARSVRV